MRGESWFAVRYCECVHKIRSGLVRGELFFVVVVARVFAVTYILTCSTHHSLFFLPFFPSTFLSLFVGLAKVDLLA